MSPVFPLVNMCGGLKSFAMPKSDRVVRRWTGVSSRLFRTTTCDLVWWFAGGRKAGGQKFILPPGSPAMGAQPFDFLHTDGSYHIKEALPPSYHTSSPNRTSYHINGCPFIT